MILLTTITVTNNGDVTLSNVQIVDMLSHDADILELTSGPIFDEWNKRV